MILREWLNYASNELQNAGFNSSRLDAELILTHTISHPRTWLHAHDDEELSARQREIADARLDLRLDHVPIAYILGHKDFYGRRFIVTTATLIPRPESEQIIELLNESLPNSHALGTDAPKRLVDIGTGSGCLGITAALEHPELEVALVDTSKQALTIAEKNLRAHNLDLTCLQSDLLAHYPYSPDIVLANLPYVDTSWTVEQELSHEPREALFAGRSGLALIERCFLELKSRMPSGGIAIFEADPRQWPSIEVTAKESGFRTDKKLPFAYRFVKN